MADASKRPLSQLERGAMFAGYRIERLLDRGGMGVVYEAVDPDLDRRVALKIIAPEHTQDETAVMRFKSECRLAASLEHANIVPIHRGGEFEGILYLAMRFVPGTNLRAVIDRGPMDLAQVGAIVSQVADALDAAHAKGLVHRDVKPANILISNGGDTPHVYLTDFGLTKRLGSTAEALTLEGGWVGTPDYVAPEQIQRHTIDRPRRRLRRRPDLDRSLTGESTAPALCGQLVAAKASGGAGSRPRRSTARKCSPPRCRRGPARPGARCTARCTDAPARRDTRRAADACAARTSLRDTTLGRILVDAQDRTLYLFLEDAGARSSCYDDCARVWPPTLVGDRRPQAGPGLIARKLTTVARTGRQVGMPSKDAGSY